jgi:hypothetical protein
MQELITYLLTFKRFTANEIELIRSEITLLTLQKGDFHQNTDRPRDFILHGILRAFYRDDHGNEITEYFVDENNFVPVQPDNDRQRATETLHQAVMKTELAVFSDKAMEQLSSGIAGWDGIIKQIGIRIQADQEDRIRPTMAGDATACYKDFVDKYSQIASRIPLSYLASYLGITQQSLSRVRRQLAKNAHTKK